MDELRERIEHGSYEVDADAVARALVERLSAGDGVPPGDPKEE